MKAVTHNLVFLNKSSFTANAGISYCTISNSIGSVNGFNKRFYLLTNVKDSPTAERQFSSNYEIMFIPLTFAISD